MDKVREEFLKYEFKRRIEARKTLQEEFAMDGIHFIGSSIVDTMMIIGDIEKLAKLMGCEVYESEDAKGKPRKAFEYDGIEVWC